MWGMIFLLICAMWDLRVKRIPTYLLWIGTAGTMIFNIFFYKGNLFNPLGGLIFGGVCLFIGKVTDEALGYGDSFIICLLGSYAGFLKTLWTVTLAFTVVGLFSLIFLMRKGDYRKRTIPFIPFLVISYMGVMYV